MPTPLVRRSARHRTNLITA
ncbi:UNVERIFIED_CONTAM: hypothetical protein GTU68_026995 [Idotea baltica]|nr:hypothetical protein [Idotea baltica]